MFWVQYYKDKKQKILSQKDKIFKILEKSKFFDKKKFFTA